MTSNRYKTDNWVDNQSDQPVFENHPVAHPYLRPHRGRFGTLLEQLQCEKFLENGSAGGASNDVSFGFSKIRTA